MWVYSLSDEKSNFREVNLVEIDLLFNSMRQFWFRCSKRSNIERFDHRTVLGQTFYLYVHADVFKPLKYDVFRPNWFKMEIFLS